MRKLKNKIKLITIVLILIIFPNLVGAQQLEIEPIKSCQEKVENCKKQYDKDSKVILQLSNRYLKSRAEKKALQEQLKNVKDKKRNTPLIIAIVGISLLIAGAAVGGFVIASK